MTYKTRVLRASNPGTAETYGADDMDKITDLLNGVTTDTATIASPFIVKDGRLQVRNPADTFSYTIKGSAIAAARDLTLPLTTANDTLLSQGAVQPVTGAKTYSDQKLILKNPLDTFSLTVRNPAITSNQEYLLGRSWTGLIVIDSVDGKAKYISATTGGVEFSSSSAAKPQEAIAYAISLGAGTTYIAPGNYLLDATFTGWTITASFTRLIFDPNAIVTTPNGYTGFVFRLKEPASGGNARTFIEGGFFTSGGGRLWTWLKMDASTSGNSVNWSGARNNTVWFAGVGILLENTHAGSWVNGNFFENILFYDCVKFMKFNQAAGALDYNNFEKIHMQSTVNTTIGIEDIEGEGNVFPDCVLWDINGGALGASTPSANVTADAVNCGLSTTIAGQAYTDLGTGTFIFEDTAYKRIANTFTKRQAITEDILELLTLYRPVNTTGGTGKGAIRFDAKNSASAQTIYSYIDSEIIANTAGSESSKINVSVKNAGVLTNPFSVNNTGTIELGGPNKRILLSETGLTGQRTVTFNDANTIVVGEANIQTLANKTLTTPVIASISNSGTVTVPSGADTLVARTSTDTLTNKTLTTPTINTPTIKGTDLAKTTTYTLLTTDYVIRGDASAGAFTLTLPTAVGATGKEYMITRTDILASANLLKIDTTSAQTIGGALDHYLWPGEFIKVESDGANWVIINRTGISSTGWAFNKGTTAARAYGGGGLFLSSSVGNSTTSPAANTLWATPLFVSKVTKFDTLYFNITTLAAATNARAGIYRDNGNCYPGALVFDTGSISCATTGVKSTTITSGLQVFAPGLYWLSWECSVADIQLVVPSVWNVHQGILGTTTGINQVPAYGYSVAHTFGALPDPYTAGASYLTANPSVSVPIPTPYIRAI